MSLKNSTASANAALNSIGIKEQFDAGFLFLFSGPVPATADEALDMGASHTELAMFSESDDGVTGLTFDAPSGGIIAKNDGESWQATVAFDGAEDAEPNLVATFYRFCAAGDNGRGAADGTTGYRVQGTVGNLVSGADMVMSDPDVEPAAVLPLNSFAWRFGQPV